MMMFFTDVEKIVDKTFTAFMILSCINIVVASVASILFKPILIMNAILAIINVLFIFLSSRVNQRLDVQELVFLCLIAIFSSFMFFIYAMTLFVLTTETVTKMRYRGYIIPSRKNETEYMYKLLSGELKETIPHDFN